MGSMPRTSSRVTVGSQSLSKLYHYRVQEKHGGRKTDIFYIQFLFNQ